MRLRPFVAVVFAAVVACTSNPLVVCACSPPVAYTVVYGRVLNPAGAQLPGAMLHVEAGPPGCQSPAVRTNAPVEADGRYSVEVYPVTDAPEVCVRLAAKPPAGYDLRSSDTLQLTLPAPRTFPPDSIERDLVLRAP